MSDPYLGEIRMFAGTFAPRDWAFCDGQTVSINTNQSLFSLLGTQYGGNGTTTFGLPDLRSRLPVHFGQGNGLSSYAIGEQTGVETVTLTMQEMPIHTHAMTASASDAASDNPAGNLLAKEPQPQPGTELYVAYDESTKRRLVPAAVGISGGASPHMNVMPFLCINFIICLAGIFPSRN